LVILVYSEFKLNRKGLNIWNKNTSGNQEPLAKEEVQGGMLYLLTECKGRCPEFHLEFSKYNIQISD
jgi:hypothetical protein